MPIIISRFESAYAEAQDRVEKRKEKSKIEVIVAAFILLDIDGDREISHKEFESLLRFSQYLSNQQIWEQFNAGGSLNEQDDTIDLCEFVNAMLDENMFKQLISGIVSTSRWQAFIECNIFRNENAPMISFLIGVLPGLFVSFLYNLSDISTRVLDGVLYCILIFNVFEIILKMIAFGMPISRISNMIILNNNVIGNSIRKHFHNNDDDDDTNTCLFVIHRIWECMENIWPYLRHLNIFQLRYFNFDKYPDPPLVNASVFRFRQQYNLPQSSNFIYLRHCDWKWSMKHLNIISPLKDWDRKQWTMVHIIDFILIAISLIGILIISKHSKTRRVFLQIPLLRVLTTVIPNRKLIFAVVNVVPNFLALLAFQSLYTFIWARIGVSLFAGVTNVITDEIYSASSEAKFDSLKQGLVTLLQLTIGEGWHEVMYLFLLAKDFNAVYYFVGFIIIITVFVNNLFVGLMLAGMEHLQQQRANDEIKEKCMDTKEHEFFSLALQRKIELQKEIEKMQRQVNKIETFLQLRQTQSLSVSTMFE